MEETAQYMANGATHGIIIISADEAKEIIETREPRGLFMLQEMKFIGIDNRTGDAWTESFDTYEDCVDWLLDPNREAQEEADKLLLTEGEKLKRALELVVDECAEALKQYPERRNSAHEALAYILEEVRELEQEVYKRRQDVDKMRTEAAHVAVTAIRLIAEVCEAEAEADTASEAMARVAEHDGTADKMARGE